MVPVVGNITEAIALRDDVEEYEEAFFHADVGADLRLDVCKDPVGEFTEGLLIHVGEALKALRDCEEERHCAFCAW